MRNSNISKTAATKAQAMPFNGLGFAMDAVLSVVKTMTVSRRHTRCDRAVLPTPELVVQSSGYSLLVALGREIRGR